MKADRSGLSWDGNTAIKRSEETARLPSCEVPTVFKHFQGRRFAAQSPAAHATDGMTSLGNRLATLTAAGDLSSLGNSPAPVARIVFSVGLFGRPCALVYSSRSNLFTRLTQMPCAHWDLKPDLQTGGQTRSDLPRKTSRSSGRGSTGAVVRRAYFTNCWTDSFVWAVAQISSRIPE